MQVTEKYPLAYTQRFNLIDSKIEALRKELEEQDPAARYLDILENPETGRVIISLLNSARVVISQKVIEITGKLIKSSAIDWVNKSIQFTCLDSSIVDCDISDIIDSIDDLKDRVEILEGPQSAFTYEEAMELLESEEGI